ncbi:hypothetical protein ACHAXT_013255 [Thalassiosira profunda]
MANYESKPGRGSVLTGDNMPTEVWEHVASFGDSRDVNALFRLSKAIGDKLFESTDVMSLLADTLWDEGNFEAGVHASAISISNRTAEECPFEFPEKELEPAARRRIRRQLTAKLSKSTAEKLLLYYKAFRFHTLVKARAFARARAAKRGLQYDGPSFRKKALPESAGEAAEKALPESGGGKAKTGPRKSGKAKKALPESAEGTAKTGPRKSGTAKKALPKSAGGKAKKGPRAMKKAKTGPPKSAGGKAKTGGWTCVCGWVMAAGKKRCGSCNKWPGGKRTSASADRSAKAGKQVAEYDATKAKAAAKAKKSSLPRDLEEMCERREKELSSKIHSIMQEIMIRIEKEDGLGAADMFKAFAASGVGGDGIPKHLMEQYLRIISGWKGKGDKRKGD